MKQRGFKVISFVQWLLDRWNMSEEQFDKIWSNDYREQIIKSYESISLPKRATAHSAGYDVFSPFDFSLKPNEDIKIPTGWKAYMLEDEKLVFHPRSGLGFKYYIRLANTTGIGDSDYFDNESNEGHYWVKIRNEGYKEIHINKGDAIVQCIFEKYLLADNDNLTGEKRTGGFGSTDKK